MTLDSPEYHVMPNLLILPCSYLNLIILSEYALTFTVINNRKIEVVMFSLDKEENKKVLKSPNPRLSSGV